MNKQGFKRRGREIFSRFKSIAFVSCIIVMPTKPLFAQVFPVQANINVTPPYSVYLNQYTSSDQEKVMVSVLLHDPVITSIDVKFRFIIQGGGIKLTTNPSWKPQPFSLTGGITSILPQELIAEYFKPQNLLIEGVNPQDFYRSGKLPEGFYEFKVEVIEYRRGITISNTGRTGVWLLLNEPPRIVFPFPNQKVQATNPQMLNFTWVPGGVSSPLSNLNTRYEFTLVEMVDKSVDPTVAITTASSASKFVRTVDQTNLFYGPGEMPLTPGKTYAIRVKAYNTEGYELFKNGGYSEVRTFTFGDACPRPVSFELKSPSQSTFDINVYTDPSNTAWQARFRENTNSEGEWSELKSESGANQKTAKGLKPKTTYEVQVKGLCGEIYSDYLLSQTITTSPMADANRSCSSNPTPFAVDNASALQQLHRDDIFFAALFPVRVKQIKSQGGGKFSGLGVATLPLFNTALAVTFDDISINSLMQLTSGEVKVVRDELNLTLFGDTPITTGNGTSGSTTQGNDGGTNGTTGYPPITARDTIPVYDSLRVVNDTTVIVYPPNGGAPVTVSVQANSATLLIPADGNMNNAQIVYDGAAHPYHPGQGGANSPDPKEFAGFIAHFKQYSGSTLGFDTLRYGVLANYYKQLTIAGKQYYLPWKALKEGMPDPVNLFVKQGTDKLPYSNLKVKQVGVGDLTPSAGAGTQSQTYMISGSYKGLEESVVAYYTANEKEQFAGGLYTATYGELKQKLYLVPVKDVQMPESIQGRLANDLSAIYAQAVASWSVGVIDGFKGADLGDNGLDWADKDMLSSYNAEMNSVISAFKEWMPNPDPDAYYLFVVPSFSQTDVEGYMPRNRRFGFITKDQLDARTVAHELGHGAFNLHHTFSTDDWAIAQSSTDNLMDYNNGNMLWKAQWDYIHNPEATTGLFDGMEEGAMSLPCLGLFDDCDDVLRILEKIKKANSEKKYMELKQSEDDKERVLVANSIKIEQTEYSRIRLIYKPIKDKKILFDPLHYNDYSQDWFKTDGSIDHQKGFAYSNEGKEFLRILIEDKEFEKKKDSLKKYLFGIDTVNNNEEKIFLKDVNWYTQCVDGNCKNSECYNTCVKILTNFGATITDEGIFVAGLASPEQYNTLVPTNDFKYGIEVINKCLENGLPVIVGVNHEASKPSANCKYGSCATYHFIVIVGRIIKNKLTYYRFFDVGAPNKDVGANENNLLLLDVNNSTLIGNAPINNWTYSLTYVRRTFIPQKK